jgi:hypothetical protein
MVSRVLLPGMYGSEPDHKPLQCGIFAAATTVSFWQLISCGGGKERE